MKILIVSNLFPPDCIGGYELGCSRIAQALAARGHDVVVATSRAADAGSSESTGRLRVRRVFAPLRELLLREHPPESPALRAEDSMKRAGVEVAAMGALREVIALDLPDVIYLFNPVGLGPLGLMETILGSAVPAVFHLMDNLDLVLGAHWRASGLRARLARIKMGFTALSCSRGCLGHNSHLGRYAAASVIYSGIEEIFSPEKRQLEPAGARFRFVCSGQVTRPKGIPQLLAAFHQARLASTVPLELHLIGRTGNDLAPAMRLGADGVVFHGHQPHDATLEMLRRMDAGVYPLPDTEAFGYAPIECLSAGVPAILPRRAGCSEMLPDTYPLFVSSRDRVDELAELMARTARDGALRRAALVDFARIRRGFSFAEHTLPGIEESLRSARCFRAPPDSLKTRAFAESVTAMARTQPELLFRSL